MATFNERLELVKNHLEDCSEFNGFVLEKNPVDFSSHLVCTACNAEWEFDDLNSHELIPFVQGANMMAHVVRRNYKIKDPKYQATVCVPLLGFCVDQIDLDGDNYG